MMAVGGFQNHGPGLHGAHQRRSGSSKPKKKNQNGNIKIIKNISNHHYIFNNPQIEIKNGQVQGGHMGQAQHMNGSMNTGMQMAMG
jgi:hypothetical protein